jgi:hypothetical protein
MEADAVGKDPSSGEISPVCNSGPYPASSRSPHPPRSISALTDHHPNNHHLLLLPNHKGTLDGFPLPSTPSQCQGEQFASLTTFFLRVPPSSSSWTHAVGTADPATLFRPTTEPASAVARIPHPSFRSFSYYVRSIEGLKKGKALKEQAPCHLRSIRLFLHPTHPSLSFILPFSFHLSFPNRLHLCLPSFHHRLSFLHYLHDF